MEGRSEVIHIPAEAGGEILRDFLNRRIAYLSAKGIRKAIRTGKILVNGERIASNFALSPGDQIDIRIEAPRIQTAVPELAVVIEDHDIAAVDKPAGMLTSSGQADSLSALLPSILMKSRASDALIKPICIHRLDKLTRGLVLVAKTRQAARDLTRQFDESSIEKHYLACVIGSPPVSGTMRDSIEGKAASSWYRRISTNQRLNVSWVMVQTGSGRKHQVRRHLSGIGHPILGDPVYADRSGVPQGEMQLIAGGLKFWHPRTGGRCRLRSSFVQTCVFDIT